MMNDMHITLGLRNEEACDPREHIIRAEVE
jgi:hypothetical protein